GRDPARQREARRVAHVVTVEVGEVGDERLRHDGAAHRDRRLAARRRREREAREHREQRGASHAPICAPPDAPLLPDPTAPTARWPRASTRHDPSRAWIATRFPRRRSVTVNGEARAASRATGWPSRRTT